MIEEKDLSKLDESSLSLQAAYAGMRGKYEKASQYQYWLVQRANEGRYDLACYESQAGHVEAAIYWLQEAGKLDGVYARWAELDPDLENVRKDARWPKLSEFIKDSETYWKKEGAKPTTLIVPEGYKPDTEIPLIVWLPGMGMSPNDRQEEFQELADKHHVAFLGVSGTIPTGRTKYAWADVAEEDYARVSLALKEVESRVRPPKGGLITLGFSQGAMVGVEITARHPEEFIGAITISAGTGSPLQLDQTPKQTRNSNQRCVFVCGGGEPKESRDRTEELAAWFKGRGAKVELPSFPFHSNHDFPTNYKSSFPYWLQFIRGLRGSTAKTIELSNIRTYIPAEEETNRFGEDFRPVSGYIEALLRRTEEILDKEKEPTAKGIIIAVGIKSKNNTRIWCEAVDGEMPEELLRLLEEELSKIKAVDPKKGPVGFALAIKLYEHEPKKFPEFPKHWMEAATKTKSGQLIPPHDVFKKIWPD